MSLKSWGFELWDQVDKLFLFTNQGIEQLELFFKTVSDIHKIYLSLAKKYKNLSVTQSNKTRLILESSTYVASLNKMYLCMAEQSSVYECEAEELKNSVITPIKSFLDASRSTVNEQKNEFARFKQKMEKQKGLLDLAWSRYYNAYVVKKRADMAFHRVKDDKTVPRVDIEKVQAIAIQKVNDLEKAKGDYAVCLQQFNKERCTLFLKDLPQICCELEMVDRQRAEITIEVGQSLVSVQSKNLDKTGVCNAALGDAIKLIDFRVDSKSLVDTYKTTSLLPADIVFADLATCTSDTFNTADFPGLLQQGGAIEKKDSPKSLFAGTGLKGIEIKEMLPEQVKQRLEDITNVIPIIEKELAGLKTLFETYRKDPTMGDKAKLEPQIDTNERKLVSLNEMKDFVARHMSSGGSGGSRTNFVSSNVAVSKSKVVDSDDGSFDEDDDEDFVSHEAPAVERTKMAKVLYGFEATDPQQLTVGADQKVKVVNYDDGGTGWTLVQSCEDATRQGYVPTNYIELL